MGLQRVRHDSVTFTSLMIQSRDVKLAKKKKNGFGSGQRRGKQEVGEWMWKGSGGKVVASFQFTLEKRLAISLKKLTADSARRICLFF